MTFYMKKQFILNGVFGFEKLFFKICVKSAFISH